MEMLKAKIRNNALLISILKKDINLLNIKKMDVELKSILSVAENDRSEIIFDLSSVKELDSSFIAFLVRAHLDASRKDKKLFLEHVNPEIIAIMDQASLTRDFNIR